MSHWRSPKQQSRVNRAINDITIALLLSLASVPVVVAIYHGYQLFAGHR